jgi:hypothetical protein
VPVGDGLPHKKDHNRIRKEKREKKALELALLESKKVQFQIDDFEVDEEGGLDYLTTASSSSSSLKTLLYRAHNGSENRTDPVDMKNNHGKLDERSYAHNPYEKSYGHEGSWYGRKGERGQRHEEGGGAGKGQKGGGTGEDLTELATLLTHIRK